nr:hypothetical protein [Tanacetum cinerariifolium]
MSSYNHFGCSWCGGPFNGGNCPGCSSVGSENGVVYDPNPYSYNETPNFFNQPRQHQYETYSELFRKLFNDVQNIHEEVIHEMSFKTYSNPLFDLDEEIISSEFNLIHKEDLDSTLKNDRFDTKCYLVESLLNRDTLMASSLKFDSLLEEFFGKLAHTDLILSRINEANYDPEEDIHLVKRLLYDNSSPRPPKEFNFKNSDAIIESFSPSLNPVEDSGHFMEEIDLFLTFDGSIPSGIDSDYSDSKRDNLFLERLLHDDLIPLSDILDFSNVVRVFLPFFTYLMTSSILSPPGVKTQFLTPTSPIIISFL